MTARETLLNAKFDKIMRSWKDMIKELVLEGLTLKEILDLLTAAIYSNALIAADGNQCRAASNLGIHRNTLHRKLADHGLLKPRKKRAPDVDSPRRNPSLHEGQPSLREIERERDRA